MHITSEPQEWTPIDLNFENELLNAYARIEELETIVQKQNSDLNLSWHTLDLLITDDNQSVADRLDQRMKAIMLQFILEQKRPGGLLRND